jgi:hypothetical protein
MLRCNRALAFKRVHRAGSGSGRLSELVLQHGLSG